MAEKEDGNGIQRGNCPLILAGGETEGKSRLVRCINVLVKGECRSGEHQASGGHMKYTCRSREWRLPTDVTSDGQALPRKLHSKTKEQVSHVPCEQKLLSPVSI